MNRNVVDCCSYGEIAIMKDDFYEWLVLFKRYGEFCDRTDGDY